MKNEVGFVLRVARIHVVIRIRFHAVRQPFVPMKQHAPLRHDLRARAIVQKMRGGDRVEAPAACDGPVERGTVGGNRDTVGAEIEVL